MDLINEMFVLQARLNCTTNGESWLSGETKDGKSINWYRCIYMEAAEAIDSFNWKHWKDIQVSTNWENLSIEFIDIWHFVMSEAIVTNNQPYAAKCAHALKPTQRDAHKIMAYLEQIMRVALQASINQDRQIRSIISLFFDALTYLPMNLTELYQYYVVKNILNSFRQAHGYKEGSYQKNWHDIEDNVVATQLMREQIISPAVLYEKLTEIYQAL